MIDFTVENFFNTLEECNSTDTNTLKNVLDVLDTFDKTKHDSLVKTHIEDYPVNKVSDFTMWLAKLDAVLIYAKKEARHISTIEAIEAIYSLITKYVSDFYEKHLSDSAPLKPDNSSEDTWDAKYKELETKVLSIEKEASKKIEGLQSSIIGITVTILGIFVAITFAAFGVTEMVGNVSQMVTDKRTSIFYVIFVFSLLGAFIINLVFLLFYCISRFIDRSIATSCRYSEQSKSCEKCNKKKIKLNKKIRKMKKSLSKLYYEKEINKKEINKLEKTITGLYDELKSTEADVTDKCGLLGKLCNKFSYIFIANTLLVILILFSGLGFSLEWGIREAEVSKNIPTEIEQAIGDSLDNEGSNEDISDEEELNQ